LVRSLATRPLSEEVQEQLGRLQSIIDAYEPGTIGKDFVESLFVAAKALFAEKPRARYPWDLEFYLIYSGGRVSRLLANITGGWPMVMAGIGMLCAICLFIVFWVAFVTLNHFHNAPKIPVVQRT
jgi:hypothetical protein